MPVPDSFNLFKDFQYCEICEKSYTDEDFDKAQAAGVSNSQLYKQAGNAIVKQVLMTIFSQLIY